MLKPLQHTKNYIADHWYGRQSFAWSFWVNFILLRALIFITQDWLSPVKGADYTAFRSEVLFLMILFHGIVFTWQILGVFRSAEAYLKENGTMAMANFWGAQVGVILAFWLTATYAYGAWQMTLPAPDDKVWQAKRDAERASRYKFTPSEDGYTLAFTGSIELGVTKVFAKLLERHPNLHTVALTSPGGNIYEARGISKMIREKGLATFVETECSSACTTVFIGGKSRKLNPGAKLGFHQYRIDAGYDVLNFDAKAEMEQDRNLYAIANVRSWFLEKMFQSRADEMWYPSTEELMDAGVITHISSPAPN
ncbi:hypothetical protein [Sneathiella limimaris]|uniref:COG3904 family protein n=1 Tax=Sneathiella limimaris TaxID=1964213 RepID=UPI00146DD61E|nr:hypothetical protein [Sneathiella limimaris]